MISSLHLNAPKPFFIGCKVFGLSICLHAMFVSSNLFGHPGHETLPLESQSLPHYLFEPLHSVPAIVSGLIFMMASVFVRRFLRLRRSES
jgi:hypothetical protein